MLCMRVARACMRVGARACCGRAAPFRGGRASMRAACACSAIAAHRRVVEGLPQRALPIVQPWALPGCSFVCVCLRVCSAMRRSGSFFQLRRCNCIKHILPGGLWSGTRTLGGAGVLVQARVRRGARCVSRPRLAWCALRYSAGGHVQGQTVAWTGAFHTPRRVAAVKIDWPPVVRAHCGDWCVLRVVAGHMRLARLRCLSAAMV